MKTILVYLTDSTERVLGGDPLTLYIPDQNERQEIVWELSRALRADSMQLKNGDYLIVGSD